MGRGPRAAGGLSGSPIGRAAAPRPRPGLPPPHRYPAAHCRRGLTARPDGAAAARIKVPSQSGGAAARPMLTRRHADFLNRDTQTHLAGPAPLNTRTPDASGHRIWAQWQRGLAATPLLRRSHSHPARNAMQMQFLSHCQPAIRRGASPFLSHIKTSAPIVSHPGAEARRARARRGYFSTSAAPKFKALH